MGYYTDFDITCSDIDVYELTRILNIKVDRYKGSFYCDNERNSVCLDSVKWYDYTEDMHDISEKYPHFLFILKGRGEDGDDIWVKYFLNGESEYFNAEITFPETTLLSS